MDIGTRCSIQHGPRSKYLVNLKLYLPKSPRDAMDIGIRCPIRHGPRSKNILTATADCRKLESQKHLRWTIVGPDSSYSLMEERIEPPIHTEYFRSGGATTLIFIVEGAKAVSSFVILSPMPANMVVPPESTTH